MLKQPRLLTMSCLSISKLLYTQWLIMTKVQLICRTLHHPNILTFMGLIKEPGQVMIITNYVDGLNLFELLHSEKKVCL